MKANTKIQLVGNHLLNLKQELELLGFTTNQNTGVVEGISILSIVGERDEESVNKELYTPPFDSRLYRKTFLPTLLKNAESIFSKYPGLYGKGFSLHHLGKSDGSFNDAEYLIISNNSLFHPLLEKNERIYSMHWPTNKFLEALVNDKNVRRIDPPFNDFEWEAYYIEFINVLLKYFDSDHIILIQSNYAQYYFDDQELSCWERKSEFRDFIKKADRLFYDMTKCKCIPLQYTFIPGEKKKDILPQNFMGKRTHKKIAHEINELVCSDAGNAIMDFSNRVTEVLLPHIKDKKELQDSVLESLIESEPTDINDVLSVFLFFEDDDEALYTFFDKLETSGKCYPISEAKKLFFSNCDHLSVYEDIDHDLVESLLNFSKIIVLFTDRQYLEIDHDNKTVLLKSIEFREADVKKIANNGYVCDYREAEAAARNLELKIIRENTDSCDKPYTISFSDPGEFYESLFFINYKELMSMEIFSLRLSRADKKKEIVYDLERYLDERNSGAKLFELFDSCENVSLTLDGKEWNSDLADKARKAKLDYYCSYGEAVASVFSDIADDTFMFVMGESFYDTFHLGDFVRVIPYVTLWKRHAEKERGYTVNKIIVVTIERFSGLVKMNTDVDEVITLPSEQVYALNTYALSVKKRNLIGSAFRLKKSWGDPNMLDVLEVPEEYVTSNKYLLRFPSGLFEDSYTKAKLFFEKNGIIPENTVILFPYAQTAGNLESSEWQHVITYFKDTGYNVFTNVGLGEKPLDGTGSIDDKADVVLAMGALGAVLIGVQSGFMDSTAWLNILFKTILLFPLDNYQTVRLFLGNGRTLTDPFPPHSLSSRIEWRDGSACSIAISNDLESKTISDDIIGQAAYFIKGNHQYLRMTKTSHVKDADTDLNSYIRQALDMEEIVIMISAHDTAGKHWDKFLMKEELHLKSDLSANMYTSYIAYVDKGSDVFFEESKRSTNFSKKNFVITDKCDPSVLGCDKDLPSDNHCCLYSYAMDPLKATQSGIIINGIEYSKQKRGLNIVLYSKTLCHVIDSVFVDMWADEKLMIKR